MDTRSSINQVRILFALAGLHRVDRGAEIALISVARELTKLGHEVTLVGSGPPRPSEPYRYLEVPSISRGRFEGWPKIPTLRNETSWEEATFAPGLLAKFRPSDFEVTATCAFPFTHWALRRPTFGARRPRHIFITQNGDWPAYGKNSEFRFFSCDGLVCTNADYFERNRTQYRSALIPNGVDLDRFRPGRAERERFAMPFEGPVILMVSALIPSKNVAAGIAAAARVPNATLVVAGDGPLRTDLKKLADELLPGRYRQMTVPVADMPALYRSADVFMHLSVDESFGNVFVEAMATGIPTVAIDTARTRGITGDDCYFANGSRPDQVADALGLALETGEGRQALLLERAKSFAWRNVGGLYDKFFTEVVEGQAHATGVGTGYRRMPARIEESS